MKDLYFEYSYAKLYEKAEKGVAKTFEFNSSDGNIRSLFILRPIPNMEPYYDIVTPYGYGGPYINKVSGDKERLIKEYGEAFKDFCYKNHIVSEFVRFHPLFNNAQDFSKIYDVTAIRNTIGTNLKDYENPIQEEFSKSCKKNIRRAIKDGVTYKVTYKPDNIDSFKNIYYSTMNRNNAEDYYYFDDEYFNLCMRYFKKNIVFVEALFEEKTIAAGLYFVSDKNIHIHLSGTLSEYLYLSPAYILRYAITLWGKEHNYEMIHHGGGRSNSAEDNLYLFKKQFGKNTEFSFCVGKKIWNEEIYKELCQRVGVEYNREFFPAYRMKL